jgi:hypothetical protein
MPDQDEAMNIFDFTGGQNSFFPEFQVANNQAISLQNINIFDRGFEKRRGDTAFNSSAMVSSSTVVTGMGYMKFNSGTEFLNAVAGAKFFTSSSLSGTMADKTGSLTITAGQNNFWTANPFNNIQIWFGGAPDAPFKHDGTSGNAAALGGTPPSARTAFVAANRIFAISTSANPSILQWPVLSDPEDWTGTGSGSQQVSKNDGEELLFGVPIGNNVAILFKNSSTHKVLLDTAPFPVIPIQKGIGAAGRNAWVLVNGTIYFITPSRRMKATLDGTTFIDFPSYIDDVWDSITSSRIPYIQGIYYQNLEQIHWYVSIDAGTTNTVAIIWDLRRKAWLKHTSGYDLNVAALVQNRRLFGGHYNGKIYEKDVAATYTDASETSPGTIDAFWQTRWFPAKGLSNIIHPRWAENVVLGQSSGTFNFEYGFDFVSNLKSQPFSMQSLGGLWGSMIWGSGKWGQQTSVIRRAIMMGRGNVFSMRFRNNNPSESFQFQGSTVYLRPNQTRKVLQVS